MLRGVSSAPPGVFRRADWVAVSVLALLLGAACGSDAPAPRPKQNPEHPRAERPAASGLDTSARMPHQGAASAPRDSAFGARLAVDSTGRSSPLKKP